MNGNVKFNVNNGVITLIEPVQAEGAVQLTGASSFNITSGALKGAHFGGIFDLNGENATVAGNWDGDIFYQMVPVTGSGTWSVTRTTA